MNFRLVFLIMGLISGIFVLLMGFGFVEGNLFEPLVMSCLFFIMARLEEFKSG